MRQTLLIVAAAFAVLSLAFFVGAVRAIKRRRLLGIATGTLAGLLLLSLGALSGLIAVSTQGYRALTREDVAAVVTATPLGDQSFRVSVRLPDGELKMFNVAGDEVYVDARILKWKPWVNVLGLHTSYELDRIAGRYLDIDDERTRPRSIFPLGSDRPVDLFQLRRRFSFLGPLVDAEYGSATFVPVTEPMTFEVRVSTTGLLIRAAAAP
jgi:hypothetical protein